MAADQVRALCFDVFGTVVDWRGGVAREARRLLGARHPRLNWGRFADAWRGLYTPYMDRVRRGELPWTKIDDLHRMALEEVLGRFRVSDLSEEEKRELNLAWHRLPPWPDARRGLKRLRGKFILGTLSNGNVRLLADMAKHAGLPWDVIISAEMVGHYKRDPRVYRTACEWLSLPPSQVMLVASHQDDLQAAHREGLRTAFVLRPREFGRGAAQDLTPDPAFDLVVNDFLDLAGRLGA